MAFVMKQYEASDPLDIGFFSPNAVVLGANGIAHLIQQFRFLAVLVHVIDRGHNHTCDTTKDDLSRLLTGEPLLAM
jgi:hypothetical protein